MTPPRRITPPPPASKPTTVSATTQSGEQKPVSLNEARRIKRDQGIKGGVLYPDKTRKSWWLEDPEGNTYKLVDGAFIRI